MTSRSQRDEEFLNGTKDCLTYLETDVGEVCWVSVLTGSDVDLETVTHVHKDNLTRHLWLVEGDDIGGKAFWRAIVSSTQLPVHMYHHTARQQGVSSSTQTSNLVDCVNAYTLECQR